MSRDAPPDVETFAILAAPGGVEVHLLQTARYKGVLALWVLEAPLDEHRAARALLPDLLTRGTARSPEMAALAARCEELYSTDLIASVTAHGPRQLLKLGFETIADRYAPGRSLWREASALLAEVVHEPPLVEGRFRADHLEQERVNLVRAIEGLADDKHLYAYRRLIEGMHAGTPFALHSWGDVESARALDEAAAHQAWDWLRDRAPARLLVVGDVTPEQVLDTARAVAGPSGHLPLPSVAELPALAPRPVQEVVERQPLAQSKLALGFRLPVALLPGPAVQLFSAVLGGGSHSRLFKRVREAESLAYGCSAHAVVDDATLVVQAGVDAGSAARVRTIVQEELDRLADDGVDEDELELSRRAHRRRLRNLRDSPRDLVAFRLYGLVTGRTHELDLVLEATERVTADDVAALAAGTDLDTVFLLEGTGA